MPIRITSYLIRIEKRTPLARYEIELPIKCKILSVHLRHPNIIISARTDGPSVRNRFLVARHEVELPHILPGLYDPPDSHDLQWAFWQGLHVGGDVSYAVFDVTHLRLGGFDD